MTNTSEELISKILSDFHWLPIDEKTKFMDKIFSGDIKSQLNDIYMEYQESSKEAERTAKEWQKKWESMTPEERTKMYENIMQLGNPDKNKLR